MIWINFIEDGRPALGSDAWYQVDGRLGRDRVIDAALERIRQLKRVKNYSGFRIIHAGSFRAALYSERFTTHMKGGN